MKKFLFLLLFLVLINLAYAVSPYMTDLQPVNDSNITSSPILINGTYIDDDLDEGDVRFYFGDSPFMAFYDGSSIDVSSKDNVLGLCFSSDGTKMYFTSNSNSASIYQYHLSTAWNVSTAVYSSKISTGYWDMYHLSFVPNGSIMFFSRKNTGEIYQYNLSVAWEISTAVFDKKVTVTEGLTEGLNDLFFSSDGNKMYMFTSWGRLYWYNLGTSWNISSLSSYIERKTINIGDYNIVGMSFSSNGTVLYLTGYKSNSNLFQNTLSDAWNVSTVTINVNNLTTIEQIVSPLKVFFRSDEDKFYLGGINKVVGYTRFRNSSGVTNGTVVSYNETLDKNFYYYQYCTNNSVDTSLVCSNVTQFHMIGELTCTCPGINFTYYTDNYNVPPYSVGDIVGQKGWSLYETGGTAHNFNISDEGCYDGGCIKIFGNWTDPFSCVYKMLPTKTEGDYVETHYFTKNMLYYGYGSEIKFLSGATNLCIHCFVDNDNVSGIVDGYYCQNGSVGYTLVANGTFLRGDSYDVVLKMNFTSDTYDIYINDSLVGDDFLLSSACDGYVDRIRICNSQNSHNLTWEVEDGYITYDNICVNDNISNCDFSDNLNNWTIDMRDNCVINDDCDLGYNKINYTSDVSYCDINKCNVTFNSSIYAGNKAIALVFTIEYIFSNAWLHLFGG